MSDLVWHLAGALSAALLLGVRGLISLAKMREQRRAYRDVLNTMEPGTALIDRSGSRREIIAMRPPDSEPRHEGGPGAADE